MDKRPFYLLNRARHRVYKAADQHCEDKLDVSTTQSGALLMVSANDGCPLKELTNSLNLNNPPNRACRSHGAAETAGAPAP